MTHEEQIEMRLQLHDWLMRSVEAFQIARKKQHPRMFVLRRQVQDAMHELRQFENQFGKGVQQ
jgi:hypothetical protein